MSVEVRIQIVGVDRLSSSEVAEMTDLYRSYYEGAGEGVFGEDLAKKDLVILLKRDGVVCGFSTLVVYPFQGIRVLFSGDTVVDVSTRNQTGLAGAFGHVMRYLNDADSVPLYWFLICKGARTYRFLPTFFRSYVPGDTEDPGLAALLRNVAADRFPDEYDERSGLLRFGKGKDRLKTDALRMDPESVRFRRLNPGWMHGDELCCFAPLAMDNLNRLGRRVIAAVEPEWRL